MWRERDKLIHLSTTHAAEESSVKGEAGTSLLGLHYWNSSTREEGTTSSDIRYVVYIPP